MAKRLGRYISPEMFFLWLLESLISSALIYTLIGVTGSNAGWWIAFDAAAADRAIALSLTVGVMAIAVGLYCPEICLQTRRLMVSSTVAGVLAFPAILIVGWLLSGRIERDVPPELFWLWPLEILLAWVFCLFTTRLVFSLALHLGWFVKSVLIVGGPDRAGLVADAISARRTNFFKVVPPVPAEPMRVPGLTELRARRIWGLVLTADARASVSSQHLLACKRAGIRIFDEVDFREQQLRRIDLGTIAPDWLVFANGVGSTPVECALRRIADVLISLVFLAFTSPLMLLTALLIKLDSPGPILYRQERVGLHGKIFTVYKFRSMKPDAEVGRGPSWASQRDPRVTRIGSFIRLSRIDELPQLVNVLTGEMSFIGPRPERPHFVETLARLIPNYHDRAFVKPGLTGWAQVNFPYGASVEDARMKLAYDLYYVRHRSLLLDILIMFSTVRVILFQEGAR